MGEERTSVTDRRLFFLECLRLRRRERNLWADTTLAKVLSSESEWHLLGTRAKQQQLDAAIRRSIRVRKIDPLLIFSHCDADGDGSLTHGEMQRALRRMKVGFAPRDLASMAVLADRSHTGRISWEDFASTFPAVLDAELLLGISQKEEKKDKDGEELFLTDEQLAKKWQAEMEMEM